MATLSELRTGIADRLANGKLIDPSSAQIDSQINSTIDYYETKNFWFSETVVDLATIAGDPILGSIPSDFKQQIQPNGLVVINGSSHIPMDKLTPLEYDTIFTDNSQGTPYAYVYRAGQFELWYTPDKVYTIKLSYRKSYADLVSDGDSNDFTIHAERLIRYKTILDLLRDYEVDMARAREYEPIVRDEYNAIKRETHERVTTGNLTTENIVEQHYY